MPSGGTAPAQPTRPLLLVEEDLTLRERLYDLLTRRGFSVLTVHSGKRALDILKHERPALIVADTTLPDMASGTLVEQIRGFDAQVPIVLLASGHAAPAPSEAQAVISKDVTDEVLLRELSRWLNHATPPRNMRWPGTVLVVDDEPKLRVILQEFLQLHGFTVVTAASGEEAIQQVEQHAPAVVLLDFQLTGMDGLVTLKKLKLLRPSLVVIMMTGLDEEQLMADALEHGAHDYVMKPFDLEYLESTLLTKVLLGKTP